MKISRFLNFAANRGVRPDYKPWERNLTRKLNLCSLLGTVNVSIVLVLFPAIGYYDSIPECICVLIMAPMVFWLNIRYGYIAASYLLHSLVISCSSLSRLNLGLRLMPFSITFH